MRHAEKNFLGVDLMVCNKLTKDFIWNLAKRKIEGVGHRLNFFKNAVCEAVLKNDLLLAIELGELFVVIFPVG